MAKAKPIKITPVSEQEAQSLYGDVEPQPFAAVGFEAGGDVDPNTIMVQFRRQQTLEPEIMSLQEALDILRPFEQPA